VALFLEVARRVQGGKEHDNAEKREIARICRLLEGLPLGIELAAGWVRTLSCQEIAEEIEDGLDFLATTLRDVPERHRSMRAVFDHSWALLTEPERAVLRRLSVSQGGLRRQAAEEVTEGSLGLLTALVDKSLLRRNRAGCYDLHEVVRQYAWAKLEEAPEELEATCDRHSAYYTDFVAGLEADLKGMRQAQALEEMSDEIDNIRVAWRWAVTRRQAAAIRKPIKGLWCFYEIRGWFQEGEATFRWASEELVRTTGSNEGSDSYLKVLHAYLQAHQGWYCLKLGRFEEAKELLQLSLAALRVCGSPAELVDALYFLGAVEWLTGDYAAARAHSTEELAVATEMGDPWEIGLAHGNIGLAVQSLGEYEEAEARWETAAAIFRGLGDQRLIAAGLRFLGELKCALGEYRKAQACLEESLALSRAIGERWIYGMCLAQLGHVSHVLGEHAEAQRLFRESVAVLRELGERWALLHTLNGLGTVALAHGAYIEARSSFREALALAWEAQALPEALGALDGLAHWQAEKGALDQALAQAVLVLNHPAAHQETRKRAAQLRTTLEAQLTPEQIAAAQACAQAMPFDVRVEDALGYGTGGDLPYKWALRMPSAWTSRLKSLKNLSEQPAG
jgi:tetratricopeptide (TPR) repeat protein